MLVVGIDPSARKIAVVATHIVLNVSLAQSFVLYKTSERQTPATLGKALDAMDEFVEWADRVDPNGTRAAWVEDPLVGRGGVRTTMVQSYVGGVVRGSLARAGFEVHNVNVSSWKKAVTGSGKSQKPAVRYAVQQKWPKIMGMVGDDGDLVDAAAICLHGIAAQQTVGA